MLEAVHGLLASVGMGAGELERIVVGVGPGGFTGLRIGIATALGLGQALGVPVRGASSLEALALGMSEVAPPGAALAPVLDARRGELFVGAYRARGGGALEELLGPRALTPEAAVDALVALGSPGAPVAVAGDGVAVAGPALEGPRVAPLASGAAAGRVRATDLVRRVEAGGEVPAMPVYVRLPDAEVNRRRALAAGAG